MPRFYFPYPVSIITTNWELLNRNLANCQQTKALLCLIACACVSANAGLGFLRCNRFFPLLSCLGAHADRGLFAWGLFFFLPSTPLGPCQALSWFGLLPPPFFSQNALFPYQARVFTVYSRG